MQQWNAPLRPPHDDGGEFNLRELWGTISRGRWLVAGLTAAALALATLFTWTQEPVYEGEATLRISDKGNQGGIFGEISALGGGGGGAVETDMLVLRSRVIAEAVADSLALHVRISAPHAPREAVVRVLAAPRDVVPGTYELARQGDGSYALRSEPKEAAERVEVDQPFRVGGALLALAPDIRRYAPEVVRIEIIPFRWAVEQLRKGIGVSRPNLEAGIVAIRHLNTDPVLAASTVNAVAGTFIRYKSSNEKTESGSTVAFLSSQVASYEAQLRDAETRLRAFREEAQIVSPKDEAQEQIKRLTEAQAQRDAVRAERAALGQLLEQTRANANERRDPLAPSPYRQLASFPVFLANQAVQNLLQSITEMENERAKLLTRRTPNNGDVEAYTHRIADMESELYRTAQSYLGSLDNQLASLDANLAQFGGELEQIPARELQFARLLREQALLEEIYTLLQKRLKEAEIQQAVQLGDVRILDLALVPDEPVSPNPVRNLLVGGALGLLLGLGAVFARQALDTKVRTREDAEETTGGIPVLGVIPRFQASTAARRRGVRRIRVPSIAPAAVIEDGLVTRSDPRSPISEAYRALRTSVTFASADRAPQVLVITSAMPGDGKTISAANLAITLAQQDVRTLLVDADLRNGNLHEVFGTAREPGLMHVLLGKCGVSDAVREVGCGDSGLPLHVLPAGGFPPNPAERLGSSAMRDLLAGLREQYDAVIFDTPPLNLVTDAAVLGTLADATLLVARAGATDKGALHHAATQISRVSARVGGIVLNGMSQGEAAAYGYGYAAEGASSSS